MRVGQEHWTRNPDGSFTQHEPSFHDLVVFGRTAERVAALFAKGDRFVAEGRVEDYDHIDPDGVVTQRERFTAKKIGHDTARTAYTVDRTPRVQQGPTNTCAIQPVAPAEPVTAVGR